MEGPRPLGSPLHRPVGEPDIMNDPAFDSKHKSMEDQDTCRICRGEGSKEEPLFYPCKCSGSIKFVHQNCLVEWLSHSQKKHCELCKTPFRFTKLYSPQMPNTVPILIFLRQAAVHTYRSLLTWSRFQIVFFVWVVWLPWSMRSLWRGLFWFGDGGWITWQEAERRAMSVAREQMDKLAAEGTTPAGLDVFASRETAAAAVVSQVANAIPHFLSPLSTTLNYSGGPLVFRFGKKLFRIITGMASNQTSPIGSQPSPVNYTNATNLDQYPSTLLSDFIFLRNFTRFPKVNRMLIDMLEGQLITLFVVVAFILIFLIREWVVQQQPAINLPAAIDAGPPEQRNPAALEQAPVQNAEPQAEVQVDEQSAETSNQALDAESEQPMQDLPRQARLQGNLHRGEASEGPDEESLSRTPRQDTEAAELPPLGQKDAAELEQVVRENLGTISPVDAELSGAQLRPSMPSRDSIARAAEIRRTLDEESRASGQKDWPGLRIFMDLWTRAERKPSEVLKIIDEEGRTEELRWIVNAMKKLENGRNTEVASPVHDTVDANACQERVDNMERQSASEDEGESINTASEDLRDDFWRTVRVDELSAETENSRKSRSSPFSYSNIKFGEETGEGQHASLRDISNQQVDGNASPPPSHRSHFVKGDSDSDFVVVGKASQGSSASSPFQPNTPAIENEDNPFNPESFESTASETVAPIGNINADLITDIRQQLEDQEQDILTQPDERNLLQSNPNEDTDAHVNQQPDIISEESPTNEAPRASETRPGYIELIVNWLWGEVPSSPERNHQNQGADDERVVDNIDEEAPFVPVAHGQPVIGDGDNQGQAEPGPDPEVINAALAAGVDPNEAEAVEDAEDLEGIMELVGMQGPIVGLIQNGMFCAVIVSLTIFFGIWIPYMAGKVFLVFLANPVSLLIVTPLRWASGCADFVIDVLMFGAGCSYYWIDVVIRFLCSPLGVIIPPLGQISQNGLLAESAKGIAENALDRLARSFVSMSGSILESDIPTFSVIARESLHTIQQRGTDTVSAVTNSFNDIFAAPFLSGVAGNLLTIGDGIRNNTIVLTSLLATQLSGWKPTIHSIDLLNPLNISLSVPSRTIPYDFTLACWDSKDRAIAIVLGYVYLGLAGLAYLDFSSAMRGKNAAGKVEGTIADILYQAGGVLKVILIISIEMIVFPLFCGLLLDVALLPLFRDATLISRLDFSLTSPYTSLFIHWFVGTCYMFHFALFVSMCRGIMRKGVLYFIRDPDDPTFHPVRDVLECSVITQLRKIIFSAVVYGGLVLICLGGVVWGISYSFPTLFPVHWSSNEPVLEFPVDLIFYNFLMPVAVRVFRPSNVLKQIYTWWFRRCARALRLSNFLFGEKKDDEEGHHVRRTWGASFYRRKGDPARPVIDEDHRILLEDRGTDVYFLHDGRYVRTPASDQVRMPRGVPTFLEVSEDDIRLDGLEDRMQGTHGKENGQFCKVYIPPFFRVRICAFIFLIWLFAATTGVGATVFPLVIGRSIFRQLMPEEAEMNDVYAFSIGIYLVGGLLYASRHCRTIIASLRTNLTPSPASNTATFFHRFHTYALRTASVVYTYTNFLLVFPLLFSALLEAYIFIPLFVHFSDHPSKPPRPNSTHTIYLIQDWVLGILYVKIIGQLVLFFEPNRPATALRGIVRRGWTNPDARLATRAFVLPAAVFMTVALGLPLGLGWMANTAFFQGSEDTVRSNVYRYSYPAVHATVLIATSVWALGRVFQSWKGKIRDEVYLIGERLHNFGEKRVPGGRRVDTR
ncbi:MAG: hypothetical protein Q9191_003544 [Dirinaria sp. TL-2023a]